MSAVLALQPLTTLFGAAALGALFPAHFPALPLTAGAVGASFVVVAGSAICALGGERQAQPAAAD